MNIRLESSCWSPALTAAAACSEVEAVREEGEGLWPRKTVASPVLALARFICGDPDNDLEGGREFKSGAI